MSWSTLDATVRCAAVLPMDFDDNMFSRTILNALPMPVFVVDDDVRISDLNGVAIGLCGVEKAAVLMQRGGEALHCLHSTDVPEGCGRAPSCRQCVVRNSVTQCLQGQTVSRTRMKMEFRPESGRKAMELLITASPIPGSGKKMAVLIVEDITEISMLTDIVPICMKCKKIRNDEQYWQSVDRYFHEHIGVEFSHGICPACSKDFYPELRAKRMAATGADPTTDA